MSSCELFSRSDENFGGMGLDPISKAIQTLPPELREIILKEFIALKIKEKKEMGWTEVHEELSKQPFCKFLQRLFLTVIWFKIGDWCYETCCSTCFRDREKYISFGSKKLFIARSKGKQTLKAAKKGESNLWDEVYFCDPNKEN